MDGVDSMTELLSNRMREQLLREGGRQGGRKGGREGRRQGGREGGREGRRQGGREGGREGKAHKWNLYVQTSILVGYKNCT